MSAGSKFGKFIKNNLVVLTVVPLIVSFHWGWLQLQKNDKLVPPDQRKDLPIVIAARNMSKPILDQINKFWEKPSEDLKSKPE